ncbi:asparaginyl-tRNA synthetase [Arcticibacter tournemirensis]|uniref:Asparagine--tRNA ligase n=1 Tax=Arcticibacter tournemirensis TaxID=699437 RepID=A0A5M9HGX2_9SPHI|nr:asparagine--tRNA ligase [Arcticibacter tournemirensis]KAA8486242.1 asparagine--tRNA ligase [Arcticibacter tournemirensis]TQM52043.1 asparaginyl-tRNA synthetase [Arcticibacter tournemirensis]
MKRTKIKDLLNATDFGQQVTVKGWVRTFRNNQFIAINDGSSINNIQAVVDFTSTDESLLKRLTTGAAVSVTGELVESLGKGQRVEIKVGQLEILGDCDAEKYPLQPKKHSLEFLREIAHLRFRTNTFNAVFKVRNALAFAIHKFFNEQGFVYMHSPIITGSDAEGAGEMFRVTTIDLDNIPRNEDGSVNYKEDFFGKSTNLTVSGQLEGELAALAFGEIYTFGPTFRAENSNTTRHLAEFWMIEPEMAFYDLNDNMDLAESLLKYVIRYALDNCGDELEFLKGRLQEEEKLKPQNERSDLDLISKLNFCLENSFERITYTEAINILKSSKPNQKKQFKYLIEDWGADLQSEHERYLVEKHFKKPVILTDYPADIKAFYMKQNDADDQGRNTVRAMDILFPGIGEIVGGSQREEVLEKLERRMTEMHIPVEEMSWFLDTRRFGSVPHSGFGLGFERLVLFVTGMTNIRDVIPFPRTPKNAEF